MTTEETAQAQRQSVFHLTGAPNWHLQPILSAVRPALLAGYRDLASLRYDFPVVLVDDSAGGPFVRSLSSVIDDLLKEIAPRGIEGERLRRDVLRAEREVRTMVAQGTRGMLTDLLERAAPDQADVRARMNVDGLLADCDRELARRLVQHAWQSVQRDKADHFHAKLNRLVQALSDILRAAFIHSEAGSRPESLRAAFGSPHQDQFDFETMSRLLGKNAPQDELATDQRERIEWALEVLRRQRFFAHNSPTEFANRSGTPFDYCFDSCAKAVEAFRERLPELVELIKAMTVAELEADGSYVASEHDTLFGDFDEESFGREDLALFPDYLVCVDADQSAAAMELLASDLPVKVLVETEELLDAGQFGFGIRTAQLASTAVGLVDVYALQTTSSNLYQLRERLLAGLQYEGPTLISIFSGAATPSSDVPAYLMSAAALEGRGFPAFTYDPTAGPDLASRVSVDGNPQPELDWPLARFEYADASLQRVVEHVAFTLADFAVCDPRHARRFARIPREHWDDSVPVDQWLSLDPEEADARVPYVLVVDENDVLQRLIVDAKLMQAVRRCRELWHGLQELGLARVRAEPAPVGDTPTEDVEAPAAEPPEDAVVEKHSVDSVDEPWIETARCSTCNECTIINDRMFAYNENKQAYIKDPGAGTFRELVEAAEACQVAVIHPGKPRDPNEPGLDDLVERAKPFQ